MKDDKEAKYESLGILFIRVTKTIWLQFHYSLLLEVQESCIVIELNEMKDDKESLYKLTK